MTEYLKEWKNLTYAAASGQVPTIIEAFECAMDRAEARAAGNVVSIDDLRDSLPQTEAVLWHAFDYLYVEGKNGNRQPEVDDALAIIYGAQKRVLSAGGGM